MHGLLTNKKVIIALCTIRLAIFSWWIMQPRHQGKSMEWWFDRYLEDYTLSSYNHKLPLSRKQEQAIQAFRAFGESGVPFLVRDMHNLVEEFEEGDLIYEVLRNLPWNEHRDFRREWIRRGQAAYDLLEKLGIPYEWAVKYAAQAEPTSTHRNAFLIEMSLLHVATNHHDKIVRTLIPHLQKGDPKAYGSRRILSKTNIQAHAAIPQLLNNREDTGQLTYQIYAKLAPDSSEIRTLLKNRMNSENPRVVFLAALATLNVEGNHDLAIERIRSSFDKVLAMPDGNQNLLYSMLRTLIQWPYPIEPLKPTLLDFAHQSGANLDQITEILFDRQTDISPLLPNIRKQLNKPLSTRKYGQVKETRIQMCLILLKKDYNDPAAWNHLNQTMAQIGTTIPIMCTETALIQLLAPHSSKARDLLKQYPRANHRLHPEYLAYTRALLRKYELTPGNTKSTEEPRSQDQH